MPHDRLVREAMELYRHYIQALALLPDEVALRFIASMRICSACWAAESGACSPSADLCDGAASVGAGISSRAISSR